MQVDRWGIFGASGSGKTTLAAWLVHRLPRVVWLDPIGEFAHPSELRQELFRFGFSVAKDERDLERRIVGFPMIQNKMLRDFIPREFRVLFTPRKGDLAVHAWIAWFFLKKRWLLKQEPVHLVVDEAEMLGAGGPETIVNELALRGRHYGIHQFYLSQRPQLVSRTITSQLNHLVVMFMPGERDADYFKKIVPEHLLPEVQHFKTGEFLHHDLTAPAGEERTEIVRRNQSAAG